jgi:hypothetical protein
VSKSTLNRQRFLPRTVIVCSPLGSLSCWQSQLAMYCFSACALPSSPRSRAFQRRPYVWMILVISLSRWG